MENFDKSIFILEDDQDTRESLAYLLRGHGFKVKEFATAQALLTHVHSKLPDLFLIDFVLLGGNGLETCETLQENPLTAKIPKVIMSVISEAEQLLAGTAIRFIQKPFSNASLIQMVEKLA